MPRTLQKVFGSGGWVGGWVVVVYSEFSVLLWSKALVLDLDQAEQYNRTQEIFIASYIAEWDSHYIQLQR